jgi:hypothetical protein
MTDVGITVLPVASSKTALPATAGKNGDASANPNERDLWSPSATSAGAV